MSHSYGGPGTNVQTSAPSDSYRQPDERLQLTVVVVVEVVVVNWKQGVQRTSQSSSVPSTAGWAQAHIGGHGLLVMAQNVPFQVHLQSPGQFSGGGVVEVVVL